MKRINRILVQNESGVIIYESDYVRIYKETDGTLYFESTSKNTVDFKTNDSLEGVAALMRNKETFMDEKIWKIGLSNKYNSSAERALYWLTGGDDQWTNEDTIYKYEWSEICDIFTHKWRDKIYDIIEKSETLGDIRDKFIEEFNLPKVYEFSLSNGLI